MPLLLLALLGLVVYAIAAPASADAYDPGPLDPPAPDPVDQLPDVIESANVAFSGVVDMLTGADAAPNADANLAAFLQMIRVAEGTAGSNGYRKLFGGSLFSSYAEHPRKIITATSNGRPISSTAAGAYQILASTYTLTAPKLGIYDFSPRSQDAIAVELIRQKGALSDVYAGRFDAAVFKVRKVWASLPGAGYDQPENNLVTLREAYSYAGGSFA